MFDRKKLGDILVELQVLTPFEVDRVLQAMRRRRDHTKFGQVARDMGLVSQEHILAALAVQMQAFPKVHDLTMSKLLRKLTAPTRLAP